jgi:hypothetical protein
MKQFWIDSCLKLCRTEADFYSGARKILRPVRLIYEDDMLGEMFTIKIEDSGFTKNKMGMLKKNYYLEASIVAARELWNERIKKDKYGSVGVSCYGHYVKGDVKGATPRGSKFGPCIQAFTLTYNKRKTSVDVFYRTTELLKKFPADLVFLRDVLLAEFSFDKAPIESITFHFANVTVHPMYWITLVPHLSDPIADLIALKKKDPFFHNWVVKWTARYVCDEYSNGIQKFAQAMRVSIMAKRNIDKTKMKALQKYLRANFPKKGKLDDDEDVDD